MQWLKNIAGDIRSWLVRLAMGGLLIILAPAAAAIWKAVKSQPIPWTVLGLICALGLILVCIAVKLLLDEARSKSATPANISHLPAQVWDETLGLWKEATALIGRWARSGNPNPPLKETANWIGRFETFARSNFSLEQMKIVFEPFEQLNFRGGLPSTIESSPEILDTWQKLSAYEMHLQAFMRDDLRRSPPTPLPNPEWSRHSMNRILRTVDEHNAAERRKHEQTLKQQAARQECLDSATKLLKDRLSMASHYRKPMTALCEAGASKLDSNDDLVWICDELKRHGFENPFDLLDEYVPKNERLDFIKWGTRHANYNMTAMKGMNYFDAAQDWRKQKGHPEPSEKAQIALGIRKALSAR